MSAVCTSCKGRFKSNFDFNMHHCPASVGKPKAGESFDDYEKRHDAHAAKWRKMNGVVS